MDKMFGLNGIAGLLIATALLLSIVGFLGFQAIMVQQANANNPYDASKMHNVKMIGSDNAPYQIEKN
jgi:hypothetical protein